MKDASDQAGERDAIQRAEDVRRRRPAAPPLHEAIEPPAAAKPAPRQRDRGAQDAMPQIGQVHPRQPTAEPLAMGRDFVGQTVRERRGFMFGVAIWTLLAMVLVTIAAVTANVHVALAAVGPVAVALMLVLLRRRAFVCHVGADGLMFDRPRLNLPFAAMEEVIAGGGKKESFIICHSEGFISVPAALNVPWQAFRAFLQANLQPQLFTARLPARLQKYFDRNVALFGAREMHVFWARDHLKPSIPRSRSGLAVCLGLLAASALWLSVGISQGRGYEGWLGAGSAFGIFSCLIGLLFFMNSHQKIPRLKNWQKSGLVIGPGGLALEQGELIGELRWEEVIKIVNQTAGVSFTFDSRMTQPCVRLDVAGASIMVYDLYHRPLFCIHEIIESSWHRANG